MNACKGLIFDIKRYAINDGPGIRITLFMKGCPLSCIWCHNPEGIATGKEKLYTRKKCIGCRTCVNVCPVQALRLTEEGIVTDRTRCTVCGKCAEVCPTLAMEISGKTYSVSDLMREIEKETVFMDQSEGGVTFCGGEPLMHSGLLLDLLKRCGEQGIHRAVDTTLFAPTEIVRKVMEHTDLFLVDLKHMDSEKHRIFCGVSNEQILSNLQLIAEAGKDFFVRIPLIEGVNADEKNLRRSARFLSGLPWQRKQVHLLLYHDIAKGKHEKLGTTYNPQAIPLSAPLPQTQEQAVAIFREQGIEAILGG